MPISPSASQLERTLASTSPSGAETRSAPITSPRSVTGTVTRSKSSSERVAVALADVDPARARRRELGPLLGGELLAGRRRARRCRRARARRRPRRRCGRRRRPSRSRATSREPVGRPQADEVGDSARQARPRPRPRRTRARRSRGGRRSAPAARPARSRPSRAGRPRRGRAAPRKLTALAGVEPEADARARCGCSAGAAGSSPSFFRSALTWTSSVFVEPNQAGSQTSCTSSFALDELPGALEQDAQELELLHRQLQRLACLRRLVRAEIHADVAGLEHRPRSAPRSSPVRRRTARTRAASSAALNGFVT